MFSILMFGYLFLFTMLLCPVILIITFTEHGLRASSWWLLYLLWNAILILVIFLQTIFQKDPEKTDYILELEEAPILFAMVKEVSLKLQLPMPDRITLNMDYNMCMRQTPSWARTKVKHDSTLGIGLPFLMSHTPSAIRAVVAHELSHLHRNDAVFSRIYLYILRLSTKLSHNAIEAKHYLVFIIFSGAFYIWFSPLFYMYFYALSRSNEYKADMMKSDVEGIEPAAIELLSTAVHKSYISKVIWPQINRLAVTHTNLPVGTFERMCDMFTEGPSRDQTTRWLRKALSATTKADDTHPCLVDRLRNIGYEDFTKDRFVEDFELPQLKNPKNKDTITDMNNSASTNAARYYFGDDYPGFAE